MDDRGWGWTTSEIRQIRLVEWIVPQSADTYVPVKPFYDEQADQEALRLPVVHGELHDLARRSLIDLAAGIDGVESYDALAAPEARRLVEQLQARRADKRLRKAACRDAMVDWLYSRDAVSPLTQPARDEMLNDLRWGAWLAAPFSVDDLDAAAAWLDRHSLVKGIMIDQCEGPVRLYLTDEGVVCVEQFGSDTSRYVEMQERGPGSGPTVQIGTNSGQVQVAGDNARQVQNIGASREELQLMITGIAEIVRAPRTQCQWRTRGGASCTYRRQHQRGRSDRSAAIPGLGAINSARRQHECRRRRSQFRDNHVADRSWPPGKSRRLKAVARLGPLRPGKTRTTCRPASVEGFGFRIKLLI